MGKMKELFIRMKEKEVNQDNKLDDEFLFNEYLKNKKIKKKKK